LFSNDSVNSSGKDRPRESSSTLESLRGEDWLVRGALGEAFWDVPLVADRNQPSTETQRTPLRLGSETKDFTSINTYSSRGEAFTLSPKQLDSRLSIPDPGLSTTVAADVFELGEFSSKTTASQRRDDYRQLIGMGPQPVPSLSTAPINRSYVGIPSEAYPSYTPPKSSGSPSRTESPNSLYPTRSTDRTILYPSAPVAPQRPSVFDTLEADTYATPPTTPDKRLSDPFYQPSRRQF
jgi:hypothetical protein